jgi:hypothetical protein
MATNAKVQNFVQFERVDRFQSEVQSSEALDHAQHNFLSEVSGLIFGLITLCWIISSLFGLT